MSQPLSLAIGFISAQVYLGNSECQDKAKGRCDQKLNQRKARLRRDE